MKLLHFCGYMFMLLLFLFEYVIYTFLSISPLVDVQFLCVFVVYTNFSWDVFVCLSAQLLAL